MSRRRDRETEREEQRTSVGDMVQPVQNRTGLEQVAGPFCGQTWVVQDV